MKVDKCPVSELPDDIRNKMCQHSLFSSPDFAALWRAQGGREVCWVGRDENQIVLALLGVEFRTRPLTRFQAMPDGLSARVVTIDAARETRQESLAFLCRRLRSAGYAKVFVADFFGEFGQVPEFEQMDCEAVVLDLSLPGWEPPDATIRSEIRKAEREGSKVVPFDPQKHMPGFLKLMLHTEERHGRTPKYTEAFYTGLAELAGRDRRIRWLVVEHEGGLAASHIYLLDRGTALYWQSFFDKKYSFLKPNQHMLYSTAVGLASDGVRRLNLGASPEDATGLRNYKEKWGGTAISYPIFVRKSWIGKIL